MNIILSIITNILFLCGTAQSFVKPIPITENRTFWAIRPIVSAVTIFSDRATEVAGGGGISLQNITQDKRNYVNYSISILTLAGGSVVSNYVTSIEKFALLIAALNNTIGIGFALSRRLLYDRSYWKGGIIVAWSINFNN